MSANDERPSYVEINSSDLIAFRIGHFDMKITRSPYQREWTKKTPSNFAGRCLPMRMANQAGWLVLNDRKLRAMWQGGASPDAMVVEQSGEAPFSALSHFGHGILTFTMPFLFRTAPGTSLLFRGPANEPKDGIGPLEGLVETDWAVATAAMSWKLTRPNTWITFERSEPICMIVPQKIDAIEALNPTVRDLSDDSVLREQYHTWRRSRDDFNKRVASREETASKQGWQRHYFRGTHPGRDSTEGRTQGHRTHLRLREFATADSQVSDRQPKMTNRDKGSADSIADAINGQDAILQSEQ